MEFSKINPFARYIRRLQITETSHFERVYPLDARLFLVIAGTAKIEVCGDVVTVNEGGIVYINSFVPYTLLPSSCSYLAVNFDFTSKNSNLQNPIPPISEENVQSIHPVEHILIDDAPQLDKYLVLPRASSLKSAFLNLEDEFIKTLPLYRQKNSAQLSEILIDVLRRSEVSVQKNDTLDADAIAAYIREHLAEPIDNSVLSGIFHFHPNYINACFKKRFGKPVHRYLLEVRIMRAISVIECGETNVSLVAKSVGFSDSNYFSRYFKKITGISPGAYMQQSRKKP